MGLDGLGLYAILTVLALVASTSISTLLIPLWFLMIPKHMPLMSIFVYLVTVYFLYFIMGILIMFGAVFIFGRFSEFFETQVFYSILFILGIAMLVWSYRYDPKKIAVRRARGEGGMASQLFRWRERVVGADTNVQEQMRMPLASLMGLAFAAVFFELFTMLPYLAAIGLIAAAESTVTIRIATLAGYCVVMLLPTLALILGRSLLFEKIEPLLQHLDAWFIKYAESIFGGVLGIFGVVLMLNAIGALFGS